MSERWHNLIVDAIPPMMHFSLDRAEMAARLVNMNDAIQLVTTKPDAEIAAELKKKFEAAYIDNILPLFNEAAAQGFLVQINVAMGPFGRMVIQNIQIMKQF